MTTQANVQYGFGTRLDVPYAEAVERAKAALKEQGFGVLTEIDVKATMQAKLGVDFQPYIILGACYPPLAYRALSAEQSIGLLLPCNVIIYQDGDGARVEFMDPAAALGIVGNPDVTPVASEARARLWAALERLEQE